MNKPEPRLASTQGCRRPCEVKKAMSVNAAYASLFSPASDEI